MQRLMSASSDQDWTLCSAVEYCKRGGIPNGLARSFDRLLRILERVLGAHEQALNGR
jgi:hypothetical protein